MNKEKEMIRNRLLDFLFEFLAIFIGISASFWFENQRIDQMKAENLRATLIATKSNLEDDIDLLVEDSIEYIKVIHNMDEVVYNKNYEPDTLVYFFGNLQSSLMVNINRSGFNMLQAGDGFELLDSKLLEEISFHYNKSVKDYISNIEEYEDLEMSKLSDYMIENIPYSSIFPYKSDIEQYSFENLIKDLRFYKRLEFLDLIRTTNQEICTEVLAESQQLLQHINQHLDHIQ